MLPNSAKFLIHLVLSVFLLQACVYGPYRGRVIEEMDNQPIEGAVVVISWTHTIPNVGGGYTYCEDAEEAVTDSRGDFEIPRRIWPFETVGNENLAIYKVGYKAVGCMWKNIDKYGACFLSEGIKRDGDRAIFPLKKVPKGLLSTAEGRYPSVCGRKDGRPLSAVGEAREEYYRTIKDKP